MYDFLFNNFFTILLLASFIMLAGYVIWLKFRMAVSKARFALAVTVTMATCAAGLLAFLSGPIPIQLLNLLLSGMKIFFGNSISPISTDSSGIFPTIVAFAVTSLALVLIYKFSISAIVNWDGPVTVNVNELAKREQDNSLALLSFLEARRMLTSKPDPVASDVAVNWQQRQSDAPNAPPWPLLARNLFESAFAEAVFDDSSWRDRFQTWVGEMYVPQPRASDTVPLILFVFEGELEEKTVEAHLNAFKGDGATLADSKIFAVFSEGTLAKRVASLADVKVEIWCQKPLLRKGLALTTYARELVKRFDKDVLGGTSSTLRDTFVEAHITKRDASGRRPLNLILKSWLEDRSRRHLALTGEYGQGKSTAMLEFCVRWAKCYLQNPDDTSRVPLLIELRGQNPAETDPVAFLSAWGGRYGLQPRQLYNLIRAGEAILIFEGFDELRNAGRAYDRHEHFNALWRLAYPGTKLIFTGRPNFFLDEKEKNRTLRSDSLKGAAGNAFTELWELDRLTEVEIRSVASGFGKELGKSILDAAKAHPAFFDIISRPSMLPVVATIWDRIEERQRDGRTVTSAVLLEHYLQAIYLRKEQEIERDQQINAAPEGANYLLLPREVREVFALAIVWRMASLDARNTISRGMFDGVVAQLFDDVFRIFQKEGVHPAITQRIRSFEERYREETRNDKLERISSEVASAGIFVSDPAGGPSNLRLPHKQFYEYMIARVAWITLAYRNTLTSKLFSSVSPNRTSFENLLAEEQALSFFSEIIETDFSIFGLKAGYFGYLIAVWRLGYANLFSRAAIILRKILILLGVSKKQRVAPTYLEEFDKYDYVVKRTRTMRSRMIKSIALVVLIEGLVFAILTGGSYEPIKQAFMFQDRSVKIELEQYLFVFSGAAFGAAFGASIVLLGSINSPRLAVLRRIVAARLKALINSEDRLSLDVVNSESLTALVRSSLRPLKLLKESKSEIESVLAAGSEHEFRDKIAPHG